MEGASIIIINFAHSYWYLLPFVFVMSTLHYNLFASKKMFSSSFSMLVLCMHAKKYCPVAIFWVNYAAQNVGYYRQQLYFFIISLLVQLKCINAVYIYFLELLSVVEKRYFCKGSPIKSTIAISNGDFRLCGIVMGMSILQGGPAPNFMTHAVSCFFTGCELLTSDVKNLAYQDIVTCVSFIVIC